MSSASTRPELIRKVIALSWFTIGYNLLEGVVSIAFGLSEDSIASGASGANGARRWASGSCSCSWPR
jgi:hypothetical protein